MTISFREKKKQDLEKQLASLMQEYDVANAQLQATVSNRDRLIYKRQMLNTEEQIALVEAELEELEQSEDSSNREYLKWQADLPKIDFSAPIGVFESVVRRFEGRGGGALFLLQNSNECGGKWFVARCRDFLARETTDLKYYPIEISLATPDEFGLLKGLARYVNVDPAADSEQFARLIIDRIRKSLRSGSVVFIELKRWDYLEPQERMLAWFLNAFWTPLVQTLPAIAEIYSDVKFVVVILVEAAIPAEWLTPFCTTSDQFSDEKIVELPLTYWSREDIRKWLGKYSGLPRHQIDRMVERIYSSSKNGMPALVYNSLMEHLSGV